MTGTVFYTLGKNGKMRPSAGVRVLVYMMPVMFIVLGTMLALASYGYVSSAMTAQGIVVAHQPFDTGVLPMVEYSVDGNSVQALLGSVVRADAMPVGAAVNILYDPVVPDHIRLTGIGFNYGFPGLVILIGLALFAVSYLIWRWLLAKAARLPLGDVS